MQVGYSYSGAGIVDLIIEDQYALVTMVSGDSKPNVCRGLKQKFQVL